MLHSSGLYGAGRLTEADIPTIQIDAILSRLLVLPPQSFPPFLHQMFFLSQLFQFILAWDRHQVQYGSIGNTHTHNCFMALLDFLQDYQGELAPER